MALLGGGRQHRAAVGEGRLQRPGREPFRQREQLGERPAGGKGPACSRCSGQEGGLRWAVREEDQSVACDRALEGFCLCSFVFFVWVHSIIYITTNSHFILWVVIQYY